MNKKDLSVKLNHAKPFLISQDFIPILTHFCFDNDSVVAYNDIAGISISMESELNCAVPGSLLLKMLGTMTAETVRVEMPNDRNINLLSGKTKLRLPILSPEEFVFDIPNTDDLKSIQIPKEFLVGLKKCLTSVGIDPSHPEQTGITWSLEKDRMTIFSTDNKSISMFFSEVEVDVEETTKIITPAFFCNQVIELSEYYAENMDSITLHFDESVVVAELGENSSCKIFSRLINASNLMDYNVIIGNMIEGIEDTDFVEAPEDLDSTLERASVLLTTGDITTSEVTINNTEAVFNTESPFGKAIDTVGFSNDLGSFRFEVDPALIQRGFKVADSIAIVSKLIVMKDADSTFIQLISHSNTGV